jgi:diketogulonate reductase-like aldo/keto reductase
MTSSIEVQGARVPGFMYGTAWKEKRTSELTRAALDAGFRALDTANQRKHYLEAGVGHALRQSGIARGELFLQTKFTYLRGQDERLPYDRAAPIGEQVRQSFASSLEHLGVERVDSYLLHGPWSAHGWSAQDREAWAAMQELQRAGRVRLLGVSNVSLEQLQALCAREAVAPAFVQNRCYARRGWDRELRAFCRARGIVYQGFSLLTANWSELSAPQVQAIAARLGATLPQLVFCFARSAGMLPLTGTSDRTHMQQDLASSGLALTPAELATLERLDGGHG